jgi:hypothetical protein
MIYDIDGKRASSTEALFRAMFTAKVAYIFPALKRDNDERTVTPLNHVPLTKLEYRSVTLVSSCQTETLATQIVARSVLDWRGPLNGSRRPRRRPLTGPISTQKAIRRAIFRTGHA